MHLLKDIHIVGWPLLLGIVAEATGLRARLALRPASEAWLMRACIGILHASLAAILVYAVFAFLRPAYTEWVEGAVASIARAWVAGAPIYPDTAAPGKYTVYPYGPLLFQCAGTIYAAFGESRKAVKAAYICLALLTYLLMFAVLRRHRLGARESALAVEILAVAVGIMGFMVKADIMLVFISAASCALPALGRSQRMTGLGLAILAGLAMATKIHGALYVLPAAIACLAMDPAHFGAKVFAACVIAVAVAAAPFLVPGTDLTHYIFILRTASHDGLLFGIFLSNLAFIATCVAGVHVLVPVTAQDAAYRRLMISVLAAGALVSVFAAKSEAGYHHLIPLLPYLCLPLAKSLQAAPDSRRAILFVLFLLAFQPITSVAGDIALMLANWDLARALI